MTRVSVWLLPFCFALLFAAAAGSAGSGAALKPRLVPDRYPHVDLSNRLVRMTVLLPDAEQGYYALQRYDWSGLIARAEHAGHTFFGEIIPREDPSAKYYAIGPAEEFLAPVPPGFAEAGAGDPFVKIGVGVLERDDRPDYDQFGDYPFATPGPWEVAHGQDWIEFLQELDGPRGWGYSYTKRITLTADPPGFTISHRLKNTGSKTIETQHYNHNFVIIDDDPIYPSYRLKLAFAAPRPQPIPGGDPQAPPYAEFRGSEIILLRDPGGDYMLADLQGLRKSIADNEVLVENTRTGAGLLIKGDLPVAKLRFFAVSATACPEPYVEINLPPGEQKEWAITYTFVVKGDAR